MATALEASDGEQNLIIFIYDIKIQNHYSNNS
jgi:hypothetical protein